MENNILKNINEHDFNWAEKEFITAQLGDKRLNQRLINITHAFSNYPQAQIPQAMGDWACTKAAYRFFDNSKVTFEKILEPHKDATHTRTKDHSVVLAIQDSSFIDYTSHPETTGLGFLSDENHHGYIIHPTLLSSAAGLPFGIIDMQILTRETIGVKGDRKNKPTTDKESRKWIDSYRATAVFADHHTDKHFISVADREGDIYDFFKEALRLKSTSRHAPDVLVRAAWNRRVKEQEKYLWDTMQSKEIAATVEIEVPRKPKQKARRTAVTIRYGEISIYPPRDRYHKQSNAIQLSAVYIHEQDAPEGEEPISWMLLTTVTIPHVNKALEVLQWYICRWTIEIYFKILKSGCQTEERQLEAAHRLINCLAIDAIIAWRILFITMIGRECPTLPASIIFDESEWKALYTFIIKKPFESDSIPLLGDVIGEIGKLGGFLDRQNDGHPGIICIWRGMWRLADITATWSIFNSKNSISNPPETYG